MFKGNRISVPMYILDNVICALVAMVWYRSLLFRNLEGQSYAHSKLTLWIMVIALVTFGVLITIRKQRNALSFAVAALLPYGIYSLLTYYVYRKTLVRVTFAVCAALVIIYIISVAKMRFKGDDGFGKKLMMALRATRIIISAGFLVILMQLMVTGLLGNSLMTSGIHAVPGKDAPTIGESMSTLVRLSDETWPQLSPNERVDLLQLVANIEAGRLGLPNELNVEGDNIQAEDTYSYYLDDTKRIVISLDIIMRNKANQAVESVLHEAYHSYQHRLMDAFSQVDDDLKNLMIFDDAESYIDEFENYSDGNGDYFKYFYQDCEEDARDYANAHIDDYFSRVERYAAE